MSRAIILALCNVASCLRLPDDLDAAKIQVDGEKPAAFAGAPPLFGPRGPVKEDIHQATVLGSCAFMSSFGAVVDLHPELIKSVIVSQGRSASGRMVYRVRLMVDGKEVYVSVDDKVPVWWNETANASVWASAELWPGQEGVWPLVLEKAVAKVFGSYGGFLLPGGSFPVHVLGLFGQGRLHFKSWLLSVLTNLLLQQFRLTRNWRVPMRGTFGPIQTARENGWPMVMGTHKMFDINGMAGLHGYAVMETGTRLVDGHPVDAVHVQNPWGINKYNGAIKDQSQDRGDFWMTRREFKSAIRSLSMLEVREGYVLRNWTIPVGQQLLSLTTTSTEPFWVSLHLPGKITLQDKFTFCLLDNPISVELGIVRAGQSSRYAMMGDKGSEETEHQERSDVEVAGGAGEYLLFARSDPGGLEEALETAQLTVYARRDVALEITVKEDASFEDECLSRLGKRKCGVLEMRADYKPPRADYKRHGVEPAEEELDYSEVDINYVRFRSGNCKAFARYWMDRLEHLDNYEQLLRGEDDKVFPPTLRSWTHDREVEGIDWLSISQDFEKLPPKSPFLTPRL